MAEEFSELFLKSKTELASLVHNFKRVQKILCYHCMLPSTKVCGFCLKKTCGNCYEVLGCSKKKCIGFITYEGTPYTYTLEIQKLSEIWSSFGFDSSCIIEENLQKTWPRWGKSSKVTGDLISHMMGPDVPKHERANIFTKFRKWENHKIEQSMKDYNLPIPGKKLVKSPFEFLNIEALFFDPKEGKYKIIDLQIRDSLIKPAGKGVFALQKIPKGSYSFYRGVIKSADAQNGHYTWTVKKWAQRTGDPLEDDKYYLDATDLITSNWCRYVNCPSHGTKCNVNMVQEYGNLRYTASEDIGPDDELYIDYGPEYRETNFQMKSINYESKAWCPKSKHFCVRSRIRHQPREVEGMDGLQLYPSMNLFECQRKSCEGYGNEYFFCDNCEKLNPMDEMSVWCEECSKAFCDCKKTFCCPLD
jgi:hypothetical protein